MVEKKESTPIKATANEEEKKTKEVEY